LAAQQLRERGYQALSLAGGMKAWSLAWNTAEIHLSTQETRIIQVRRVGKGCLSYLIGSGGEAAVIDAALDPEIYLNLARQHGWRITQVLDTHIHADHLSRSRLLAEAAGAALHLPAQERVTYPFTAVSDNDRLKIGSADITALHTPGHTSESTCYLINDEALITGDTLFLAAVGRPDLKADPEESRHRAHLLYGSLQKLLALPAETLILPGHASVPVAFDGQPLAAPLAEVRRQTALLSLAEEEFVNTLLQRIPTTPPNHLRIVELNEAGEMPDSDVTELEAGGNRCAAG
jgi:glyoxylase-like metal-dependent hydrolase (beta-lactamase superfamily II)